MSHPVPGVDGQPQRHPDPELGPRRRVHTYLQQGFLLNRLMTFLHVKWEHNEDTADHEVDVEQDGEGRDEGDQRHLQL